MNMINKSEMNKTLLFYSIGIVMCKNLVKTSFAEDILTKFWIWVNAKIIRRVMEEKMNELPLLRKLYQEKMIKFIQQSDKLLLIYAPYSSSSSISYIKAFNDDNSISFLDLFRTTDGRVLDLNVLLANHYVKILTDPNHKITKELSRLELEDGGTNVAQLALSAINFLKEKTGYTSLYKKEMSIEGIIKDMGLDLNINEAVEQGLIKRDSAIAQYKTLHLSSEGDLYKVTEAIKNIFYLDSIYKGLYTIGEIAKDMMKSGSNGGLRESDLIELFKKEINGRMTYAMGTSTITAFEIKAPAIKVLSTTTHYDVDIKEKDLKSQQLALLTRDAVEQYLDTKILMPTCYIGEGNIIVENIMESIVALQLKEAAVSWKRINDFEQIAQLVGTEKAYELVFGKGYNYNPTKLNKKNWFMRWIHLMAGYSFVDPK